MLLKVEGLHKIYKNGRQSLEVLKGIDLSLLAGELSVVIGPSGAGKSTLLHILAGLDRPSKGKVSFDGTDLYRLRDSNRSLLRSNRIGFVFQFYHLMTEFSAMENVAMPALIRPKGKRTRADIFNSSRELLKSVGLEKRIDHRPSELSGGEAQRVALCRALINEPDIVFCDEPTGNLDSENSELVLKIIMDLNRENKQTFMIVTHNEKMADFAKRTIRIRDGVLE